MLVTKKPISSARSYAKVIPIRFGSQLESLYARRTAVDALIQSLEDYQRYRAQRTQEMESKSA
jgi:hypothetical protein